MTQPPAPAAGRSAPPSGQRRPSCAEGSGGRLALWGGVEATVNRVGNRWSDQLRLTGHHERLDDLDRFAALGLSAIRYPILWERTEIAPGVLDWRWPDLRMARLARLGLRPIVGLVHHGAGPAWTGLLSDDFAPRLAAYAGAVARRYRHVRDWTPVNEPLTTARFSALYGHWHPHRRDERDFWLALLNQIDATRLAMRAIRAEAPGARLIQTEDVGLTYATAPCRGQADHENDRRLMTWDLLCGRVVRGHPLRERLDGMGFGGRLDAIAADPCPPDVMGVNHYVTSDRFLDHRLERYPAAFHGGNVVMAYADVEAVRALPEPPTGWLGHLMRLWSRYGLPLAVTECHIGCTREEQLRWLVECWTAAGAARAAGARVEAVTAWALVGSRGWNRLLTNAEHDLYESGAFDVSDGAPRSTALAALLRDLADGRPPPALTLEPGWWRRDERLFASPARRAAPLGGPDAAPRFAVSAGHPRAAAIVALCRLRGLSVALVDAETRADHPELIDPPDDGGCDARLHRHLDLMLDRRLSA